MPWGRVDDQHYRHRKVLELDDDLRKGCLALFWLAVSWSNDVLSDGLVTMAAVRLLGGDRAEADELVRVGLWDVDGRSFRIHDFLDFNRSREQVEADRQQRIDAGRASAEARQRSRSSGSFSGSSNGSFERVVPTPRSPRNPVSPSPVLPRNPIARTRAHEGLSAGALSTLRRNHELGWHERDPDPRCPQCAKPLDAAQAGGYRPSHGGSSAERSSSLTATRGSEPQVAAAQGRSIPSSPPAEPGERMAEQPPNKRA